MLLLLDFWPLGRLGPRRRGAAHPGGSPLEKAPLFALAAASAPRLPGAQRGGGAVAALARLPAGAPLANAAALLRRVPRQSRSGPPASPSSTPTRRAGWAPSGVALPPALLVAATAVALRASAGAPALLVGWPWYLGTLLPVIGLVQVGSQAIADRYTYLPLIGLLLAAAWGAATLARAAAARGGRVAARRAGRARRLGAAASAGRHLAQRGAARAAGARRHAASTGSRT